MSEVRSACWAALRKAVVELARYLPGQRQSDEYADWYCVGDEERFRDRYVRGDPLDAKLWGGALEPITKGDDARGIPQHPIHAAIVGVEQACFGGGAMSGRLRQPWGLLLRWSRWCPKQTLPLDEQEYLWGKRREAIRYYGYWLRGALKSRLARLSRATTSTTSRRKKWDHVWALIREENAVKGCGTDQKIANSHNRLCAARIAAGTCERIDAKKVAQIRYEFTHAGRHRKQNHKRRS